MLPPLKPIPVKERVSVVFVEKGEIDVVDGAFVVVDQQGFRVRPVLTHIPVGGVACIMLEPGTRVSHRAAALAARVRRTYQLLAQRFGIKWSGRDYNPENWDVSDLPNRCLSSATAALYGVTEAAVLAAGYAPAVGFIHTGKPLSFVYDIADIYKFETVVPAAFKVAAENPPNPERAVRLACRDIFRQTKLLERIIPDIEETLATGGITRPMPSEEAVLPAIPNSENIGDAGHRA